LSLLCESIPIIIKVNCKLNGLIGKCNLQNREWFEFKSVVYIISKN